MNSKDDVQMTAVEIGAAAPADWQRWVKREMLQHQEVLEAMQQDFWRTFGKMLEIVQASVRSGGKILLFGNGGSAADAQHLAAELVIRYKTDRAPIAAISLSTDTSALTACGNDFGFHAIFSRQLEALGRRGDVAIGISTSGNSPNVIAALRSARMLAIHSVGFVGGDGGEMAALCDVLLVVPSRITARVQEMHILIGHMLCKALEERLGLIQT